MNKKIILGSIIILCLVWWMYYSISKTNQTNTIKQGQTKIEQLQDPFEQTAISLVRQRPDVQQWLQLIEEKSPVTAVITLDSKTDMVYTVHVYEDLPDHTATFNWYDVDKTSGEIIPMFPME